MNRLLERFLRYVKVDTESMPDVEQVPSTEKQKNLSKMLADELKTMGASDVRFDETHSYVYATLPSNTAGKYSLGFIAHVDTSSAVTGKDVKPIITENYDGKDIALAQGRVLSPKDFPELASHVGKTIVSSDGTTLLGADDKAGVAVIMEMAEQIIEKNVPHGNIRIAFTPDEEVGNGVAYFDVKGFNADGAYTIDGGALGELENENFNAASAKVKVHGISVHPGTAKGTMVNASEVLIELCKMLPEFQKPEYTEKREGFFHLSSMQGSVDEASADYIIRDHDMAKFQAKKALFAEVVAFLNKKYGEGTVEVVIADSYYNMIEKLVGSEHLVENAKKAMEMAGVKPIVCPIRGGTDGAMLSYKGLPCPNLFTGGYNFHGRYEYIPLEDMQKALDTVMNLVAIYKDR